LAQEGCEVEVWVSDDASTDATPEVVKTFADDARVHYHRHPVNLGIAANASWVMARGNTEYLVRLDSDDMLKPHYCSTLAAALEHHGRAGVAHAAVEEVNRFNQPRRVRRLYRASGFQSAEEALQDGIRGYRVAANICMFRRSTLAGLGQIYRTGMNFAEDWDLFLRLAVAGVGNFYQDDVLAAYRVWDDAGDHRARRKQTELIGIRRVFVDTLAPAWAGRDWPAEKLGAARRAHARSHARVLTAVHWSAAERADVAAALRGLAPDDPGLERVIAFYGTWLGRKWNKISRVRLRLKDAMKWALRGIR
jgi:glycosyltransferase involved in cell wall biosynthesis